MATNPITDALEPLFGSSPAGRHFGRYRLGDGAILTIDFAVGPRATSLEELRLLASIAELVEDFLEARADRPAPAPDDGETSARDDVATSGRPNFAAVEEAPQ